MRHHAGVRCGGHVSVLWCWCVSVWHSAIPLSQFGNLILQMYADFQIVAILFMTMVVRPDCRGGRIMGPLPSCPHPPPVARDRRIWVIHQTDGGTIESLEHDCLERRDGMDQAGLDGKDLGRINRSETVRRIGC
ncbi:hypothetical protein B0H66DRAFT_286776 [Apodospora peruviana]|uniref:Uncharacterized protein n=1 Tax=Apodospora peruviana TaxID=516989 RepID=A0AAE0I0D3_9PEZI|nr:hypothetical protein B0H66DRAFT_286776 [Apodospora peruviana]